MSAVVIRGDARQLPLPDESVDLICTSPPYYGKRAYEDDGEYCEGQIGNEETPREWLAALLTCTREWARVLKSEGSIFVNLGDSYYSGKGKPGPNGRDPKQAARRGWERPLDRSGLGWPSKTRLFLPERYRIACLDELGLIGRNLIIWDKVNPLPDGVADRTDYTHEDIVHFTKRPRYYSAVDDIRVPNHMDAHDLARRDRTDRRLAAVNGGQTTAGNVLGKVPGSVWPVSSLPLNVPERIGHRRCCGGRKRPGCERGLKHHAAFPPDLIKPVILGWSPSGICLDCRQGRFPVTVASYDTQGRTTNGPQSLARRFESPGREVRAVRQTVITGYACPCCPYTDHPGTGKPTQRRDYNLDPTGFRPQGTYGRHQAGEYERVGPWREYHLEDWTPPPSRPAVVVDPFGGTGCTALVADLLGRTGISVDLSHDYGRLARWRIWDPGERARARGVPKPQPVPDGQGELDLFGEVAG